MDCVRLLSQIPSFVFGILYVELKLCYFLVYRFADSSFVPPLIYAFMGSSRDIAIGPVAVVSLLMGTLLSNEIDPVTHKEEYQRLAFTATFFAGITQATLGIFRYILHSTDTDTDTDTRYTCITNVTLFDIS